MPEDDRAGHRDDHAADDADDHGDDHAGDDADGHGDDAGDHDEHADDHYEQSVATFCFLDLSGGLHVTQLVQEACF